MLLSNSFIVAELYMGQHKHARTCAVYHMATPHPRRHPSDMWGKHHKQVRVLTFIVYHFATALMVGNPKQWGDSMQTETL